LPEKGGIGGQYGNFFKKGGIVGINLKLNGTLVKNSLVSILL
jgi:hypothetical protein